MTKSVLTTAQWRWVGDRWLEGYTMSELAYFLGLHRETVRRGLVRLGIRPYEKSELTPLSEREAEYKNIKEDTDHQDEICPVVDVTGVCRFEEREEAKNGKQP